MSLSSVNDFDNYDVDLVSDDLLDLLDFAEYLDKGFLFSSFPPT